MSIYSPEAKTIFKGFKHPLPGLIVDMVEYKEKNYLALRVYRDNIENFSEGQKVIILEHLYKVRDAIRDTGVNCHIEGVEDAPPNRNSLVPPR